MIMKKEKKAWAYLKFICILIAMNSCGLINNSSEGNTESLKLDLRSVIKKDKVKYYLSDFTDGIKYVQLETDSACLLMVINWLDVTQNYIFVSDSRGLYQFDKNGSFIGEIGRIGKGPGEHNGRIRFAIDKNQNEVFIYSFGAGGVNVHDTKTGHFKYSFSVDFLAHDFVVLSNGLIAFFTMETEFDINEIYFVNKKGEKLDSISNQLRTRIRGNIAGHANAYLNDGDLYYMYNYRDTLYQINNDLERMPFALFTLDNKESHNDFIIIPNPEANYYPDFISIPRMLHCNEYFFITIQKGFGDGSIHNQVQQRMLYTKTSDELHPTKGFINNIDGGMHFWPQWIRNDILIDYYHPYQILDYYNETKESLEHSDAFIELINNLNENDNPVLVFLTQK